jgi:hypothetical protein
MEFVTAVVVGLLAICMFAAVVLASYGLIWLLWILVMPTLTHGASWAQIDFLPFAGGLFLLTIIYRLVRGFNVK